MSSTATIPTMKQQYLDALDREFATTLKVLKAYPAEHSELRPHERARTARELAYMFAVEPGLAMLVLRNELKMPMDLPPVPATMPEVIGAFEQGATRLRELVEQTPEEELANTSVRFFVAPKTMGDIPKMQFLWFIMHDMIHHRGQFSVYLRMSGGKVPSIYGPSADEPWF